MTASSERTYRRHRSRMIAYGKWSPFTDAGPARRHVLALQAQGVGRDQVARLAGLHASVLSKLLYGTSTTPPTRKIRPETEAAILAVHPALDDIGDQVRVDPAGTRRRVEALMCGGWSMRLLSDRIGGPARRLQAVMAREERVTAVIARQVRDLYDELWCQGPPEGTVVERRAATAARRRARVLGFVPAGAWDDDPGPHCIDDPAAVPVPGWERKGRREHGSLTEEAAELAGQGEHPEMIAARLETSVKSVERTLTRIGQDREGRAA